MVLTAELNNIKTLETSYVDVQRRDLDLSSLELGVIANERRKALLDGLGTFLLILLANEYVLFHHYAAPKQNSDRKDLVIVLRRFHFSPSRLRMAKDVSPPQSPQNLNSSFVRP